MEVLCICLLALVTSGLGVPFADRLSQRRMVRELRQNERYGIVGSQTADIQDYPYTVSVTLGTKQVLVGGGAILNKHWILCSALQIYGYKPKDISVRVGSNKVTSGGQRLNISMAILHEKFDTDYPYDVAVMKTVQTIQLGEHAKPIKLARTAPKAGSEANITGYGYTSANMTEHGSLQVATVEVKTQKDCKKVHPACPHTCLCADATDVGPCFDDDGDPLVRNNQLIGWFIGGDSCNQLGSYDLYSSVVPLRKWIINSIKNHSTVDEMEGIDDDDFYTSFYEDNE